MKEKSVLYNPGTMPSAKVHLATMALFKRDANGLLICTPPVKLSRAVRNPRGEERRFTKRIEWRHDLAGYTVTAQGRTDYLEARSCDLSRMGCGLLLDRDVTPGSFLDMQVCDLDGSDGLPLVQVLECKPKGKVWQARCVWLQPLRRAQLHYLVGRAVNGRRNGHGPEHRCPESWLQRLWRRFHV